MKVAKSLQEVWDWKEKAFEQRKGLPIEERIKGIKEGAQELCKKYNLHLRKVCLTQKG